MTVYNVFFTAENNSTLYQKKSHPVGELESSTVPKSQANYTNNYKRIILMIHLVVRHGTVVDLYVDGSWIRTDERVLYEQEHTISRNTIHNTHGEQFYLKMGPVGTKENRRLDQNGGKMFQVP